MKIYRNMVGHIVSLFLFIIIISTKFKWHWALIFMEHALKHQYLLVFHIVINLPSPTQIAMTVACLLPCKQFFFQWSWRPIKKKKTDRLISHIIFLWDICNILLYSRGYFLQSHRIIPSPILGLLHGFSASSFLWMGHSEWSSHSRTAQHILQR